MPIQMLRRAPELGKWQGWTEATSPSLNGLLKLMVGFWAQGSIVSMESSQCLLRVVGERSKVTGL
jgi:hypothetical protein